MKCNICGNKIQDGDSICQVCGAIQNVEAFAKEDSTYEDESGTEEKPSVSSMHFGRPKEEDSIDYDKKLKQLLKETMSKKPVSKKTAAKKTNPPKTKTAVKPSAQKTDSVLGSSPLDSDENKKEESSDQLKEVLQTIFKSKQESGAKQTSEKQPENKDIRETVEIPPVQEEPLQVENTPYEVQTDEPQDEFGGFEKSEEIAEEEQWSLGEQKEDESPDDYEDYDGSEDFIDDENYAAKASEVSEPDFVQHNEESVSVSEMAETVFDSAPQAVLRESEKVVVENEAAVHTQSESLKTETESNADFNLADDYPDEETEVITEQVFEKIEPAKSRQMEFEISEPPSRLREETYEMHVTVASTMRRFLASLLDLVFAFVMLMIFMGVAVKLVGSADLPQDTNSGVFYLISLVYNHPHLLPAYSLVYFFIWVLIGFVCTTTTGQTPGKMIMGIRVIRSDGERVDLIHAVVRLIGYIISSLPFFLGFLWVVVNTEKQGLHDKLARTYVIRVDVG